MKQAIPRQLITFTNKSDLLVLRLCKGYAFDSAILPSGVLVPPSRYGMHWISDGTSLVLSDETPTQTVRPIITFALSDPDDLKLSCKKIGDMVLSELPSGTTIPPRSIGMTWIFNGPTLIQRSMTEFKEELERLHMVKEGMERLYRAQQSSSGRMLSASKLLARDADPSVSAVCSPNGTRSLIATDGTKDSQFTTEDTGNRACGQFFSIDIGSHAYRQRPLEGEVPVPSSSNKTTPLIATDGIKSAAPPSGDDYSAQDSSEESDDSTKEPSDPSHRAETPSSVLPSARKEADDDHAAARESSKGYAAWLEAREDAREALDAAHTSTWTCIADDESFSDTSCSDEDESAEGISVVYTTKQTREDGIIPSEDDDSESGEGYVAWRAAREARIKKREEEVAQSTTYSKYDCLQLTDPNDVGFMRMALGGVFDRVTLPSGLQVPNAPPGMHWTSDGRDLVLL